LLDDNPPVLEHELPKVPRRGLQQAEGHARHLPIAIEFNVNVIVREVLCAEVRPPVWLRIMRTRMRRVKMTMKSISCIVREQVFSEQFFGTFIRMIVGDDPPPQLKRGVFDISIIELLGLVGSFSTTSF
jgi:hypothetical protein